MLEARPVPYDRIERRQEPDLMRCLVRRSVAAGRDVADALDQIPSQDAVVDHRAEHLSRIAEIAMARDDGLERFLRRRREDAGVHRDERTQPLRRRRCRGWQYRGAVDSDAVLTP